MRWRSVVTALALLASGAVPAFAHAADLTPLDRYLNGLKTLRADFVQQLVDGRGVVLQNASGTLVVQRPGKFRWAVRPQGAAADGGQLLVADGRNLWFYDRDLDQVTVKAAANALTATPATLLSGDGDIRAVFAVTSEGRQGDLDWVIVKPLAGDADFRDARLGFSGLELQRMELHDKLGQTATLQFSNTRRNVAVDPAELRFVPPVGADVIGTPVP